MKVDNIFSLMSERGISSKELSEQTGISSGNISDWKSGRSAPKTDNLVKIADYFNVSVDYLLGRGLNNDCDHQYKVDVEFSKIFNYDENLNKYVFCLWEALNDIYSTNKLFNDILMTNPFRRHNDFLVVFKYNMIILCEAAKLVTLKDKRIDFESARNILFENDTVKSAFDRFIKFWEDENNSKFFRDIRNNIAHYDHIRNNNNDYYSSAIKKLDKFTLSLDHNILSDADEPLFTRIMVEIYNNYHKNTDKSNKEDDIYSDIIKLYAELCNHTIELLRSMVDSFLERFTTLSDNSDDETQTLRLNECRQEIKDSTTCNNVNNNSSYINDNHGVIGNVNGGTLNIQNGCNRPLSAQEQDILNIYNTSDGKTQMKIMEFIYQIEANRKNCNKTS